MPKGTAERDRFDPFTDSGGVRMSGSGDCSHKSCKLYKKCRWPYLAAYRAANLERSRAWLKGYRAGQRKAKAATQKKDSS